MLQRLYATVWFTSSLTGDVVMKELYDKESTDDLLARLKARKVHYKIEYE